MTVAQSPAFDVVADGFAFCEAPRVDEDGTVYWSDLTGGGYYRRRPGGAIETVLADRPWIGGAVLDAGGGVVLSGKGGLVHVVDGVAHPLLGEIAGQPIVAINDIEGDGRGGLFGGTVDFGAVFERGETPQGGIFFHMDAAGRVTVLRENLVVSNGMGFSPDGQHLYHSESTVGIWRWSIGDDGLPRDPHLLFEADDCDGLAVDAAGGIWVAFWQQGLLRRHTADGGVDRTITLPFPSLVSLAFGGADMRDLFVSTGGNADHPGKGGVIRIRSDIPGLPTARTNLARAIA